MRMVNASTKKKKFILLSEGGKGQPLIEQYQLEERGLGFERVSSCSFRTIGEGEGGVKLAIQL